MFNLYNVLVTGKEILNIEFLYSDKSKLKIFHLNRLVMHIKL